MATSPTHDAPKLGVYRRKSQVFVEIPPSPFMRKSHFVPQPPKVDSHSNKHENPKENTVPLATKTSANNIPADTKSGGKRKLQSGDDVETNEKSKKAKPVDDGLVACHQCRSKRKPDVILQCTSNLKKTGKRCKASYCEACLKTRYGETLQAISQRQLPQSREGHDPDTTYHFKCPRCSDYCNCGPCRKKKGLAPVGKFVSAKGGESVREILEKNPQASGFLPKNVTTTLPKPSILVDVEVAIDTGEKPKEVIERVPKKMKPVLEPVWRPLPQMVSRQEMEDRIYLREFILRFNPILDIGLRNIEELDDFTTLHDQSTKAVLIALLNLIAVEDVHHKTKIQAKVKIIRGLGLSWTRIVPTLHELRDSLPDTHALRSLPELKEAEVELAYNTRGARMQGLHVDQLLPVLLHLVEVASVSESVRQELEAGMKQAKEVRSAYHKAQREETERWAAERVKFSEEKQKIKENSVLNEKHVSKEKDLAMDAFKAKYRDAEAKHKAIIFDIQNSYKPEMDACTSRFMSLGSDMDGRTYYALSASGPRRGKKERLPGEGERSKKWAWFISVWGKSGTIVHRDEESMDVDEEDAPPNTERWWTFTDVHEMRQLSKWLTFRADADMSGEDTVVATSMPASEITRVTDSSTRNDVAIRSKCRSSPALSAIFISNAEDEGAGRVEIDLSQPPTQAGVKTLAKSVLEFADFIEWRMTNDDRVTAK